MTVGFLLDTNVLSEIIKTDPEPCVAAWAANSDSARLFISDLSIGEIVKGVTLLAQGKRRAHIQEWLDTVLTAQAKVDATPLPAIDGLLAATAAQFNLTVATRNTRHFRFTGVPVLNPWIS